MANIMYCEGISLKKGTIEQIYKDLSYMSLEKSWRSSNAISMEQIFLDDLLYKFGFYPNFAEDGEMRYMNAYSDEFAEQDAIELLGILSPYLEKDPAPFLQYRDDDDDVFRIVVLPDGKIRKIFPKWEY